MTLLGGDGGVVGAISQHGDKRNAQPRYGKGEPENSESWNGHGLCSVHRWLGGRLRIHSKVVGDIPDSSAQGSRIFRTTDGRTVGR